MKDPLRIRLTKTKTISEIEAMIQEIDNDPDSKIGATGLDIYNKATMKKLDEMTWAIYSIRQKMNKKLAKQVIV
jgi:hypothetical protein